MFHFQIYHHTEKNQARKTKLIDLLNFCHFTWRQREQSMIISVKYFGLPLKKNPIQQKFKKKILEIQMSNVDFT